MHSSSIVYGGTIGSSLSTKQDMTGAKRKLVIDATLCCGCLSCMINCSQFQEHESSLFSARIRVTLEPFDGVHRLVWCRQCDEAECALNCPQQAIKYESVKGYYYVDYGLCVECRTCVQVCPYGAMMINETQNCVIKCDLCAASEPMCVRSCFTGALWYGTEDDHPDRMLSRYFFRERGDTR